MSPQLYEFLAAHQVSHILFDGVVLLDQGLPLGPIWISWKMTF